MSKIEVIGPKDLLMPVLGTIGRSQTMHVDATIQRRIDGRAEAQLTPLAIQDAVLDKRLAYEQLASKIGRLLALLPDVPSRESYLPAQSALEPIQRGIDKRLTSCEEQHRRRADLQRELTELTASVAFLTAAAALVPESVDVGRLELIAVAVKDRDALERLSDAAKQLPLVTGLRSARTADGSYIGLLTTEKSLADRLRQELSDGHIPEVSLPAYLQGRPIAEKISVLRARCDALTTSIGTIDRTHQQFAHTWRQLHVAVRDWLRDQLTILDASTMAYETARCFVLFGWTPSRSLSALEQALTRDYGGTVVVREKPIVMCDLEQVPVALHNPPYLRPFEMLVKLLPPPRYTSFDTTPLIAVCFPLFFGFMVGDAGHGLLLFTVAAVVLGVTRNRVLAQAAWIVMAAAAFTVVFGVVFGEFFGDAAARRLGLEPLVDRRTSIVPMLAVAVSIGFLHVSLGLLLGVLSAVAAHRRKEALFRSTTLGILVALAALAATFVAPFTAPARSLLAVAVGLAVPLLVVSGGLIAPFELVRHLGNIASYARLMAIGLASVLLAHVANDLAAAIESIWLAVAVAIMLHAFNVVLGVFGPTIHALRLHYVEFFSKFFEPAGQRYVPLRAS